MNIASPPINSITEEYCMNCLVPKVPIVNHIITMIILRIPNLTGFAPLTTPCDARIKFSIFPKIINHIKGKYSSNNSSPSFYPHIFIL